MGLLKEDIETEAEWIIECFESDGISLDYSVNSLLQLDIFFEKNSKDGKPLPDGRFSTDPGIILFAIGAYIGQTFLKNDPGAEWITDDSDPQGDLNAAVRFSTGEMVWPMQRAVGRLKNGLKDSIYPYGYELMKNHNIEPFDSGFWNIRE